MEKGLVAALGFGCMAAILGGICLFDFILFRLMRTHKDYWKRQGSPVVLLGILSPEPLAIFGLMTAPVVGFRWIIKGVPADFPADAFLRWLITRMRQAWLIAAILWGLILVAAVIQAL